MIPELAPDARTALQEILATPNFELNFEETAETYAFTIDFADDIQQYARNALMWVEKLHRTEAQMVLVQLVQNNEYIQKWQTEFSKRQNEVVAAWSTAKPLIAAYQSGSLASMDALKTSIIALQDSVNYRGLMSDRYGGLEDLVFYLRREAEHDNNGLLYTLLTGRNISEYHEDRRRVLAEDRLRSKGLLDTESDWVSTHGAQFVATNIGCSQFLTVFANVDRIQGPIPPFLVLDGVQVPIRVLRADGFLVLRAKLTPILQRVSIGGYSLGYEWRSAAFFLVMCSDSPFNVAGYKFINKPPSEPWDITGGLENVSKTIGPEVKGVGQRLIQGTLALAKAYGIRSVKILTVESAHGFYLKMGFQGGPGGYMTQDIPYSPITRFRSRPA